MNKRERKNDFYKRLLKVVCEDPRINLGLCWFMTRVKGHSLPQSFYPYFDKSLKKHLPELHSMIPKDSDFVGIYWFKLSQKGWKKRIEIIEECIKLTEK
jgi:hypothetical protein